MKKLIFACMAIMLVTACGKNSNNDPLANVSEAAKDRDLQGKNYASSCQIKPLNVVLTGILTGGNASIKSAMTVYRFDGANVTRTTRLYANTTCTGDTAIGFEEHGDVNIHQNQKTNDGGKYIDIDYSKVLVTTVTPEGVAAANALKLCDVTDWSANSQRDETSHASDMTCYGVHLPRHNANVYRVDANILYFGSQATATNDEKSRPATLNFGDKYTAQ